MTIVDATITADRSTPAAMIALTISGFLLTTPHIVARRPIASPEACAICSRA